MTWRHLWRHMRHPKLPILRCLRKTTTIVNVWMEQHILGFGTKTEQSISLNDWHQVLIHIYMWIENEETKRFLSGKGGDSDGEFWHFTSRKASTSTEESNQYSREPTGSTENSRISPKYKSTWLYTKERWQPEIKREKQQIIVDKISSQSEKWTICEADFTIYQTI